MIFSYINIFIGVRILNIVTLTGHKHSGKSIIANRLSENSAVEYVKPYTDALYNETWSDSFHYVSSERLDELIEKYTVLYESSINGHRYVFFKEQLKEAYNVMILDDYGVANIKSNYDYDVYSIKVHSSNEKPSERVGVYLYNHEFDYIFDYDNDDYYDLEARIEYD